MQELAEEDNHELEAALGFPLFTDGDNRLGWLMNLNAVSPQMTDWRGGMWIGMEGRG